MKYLAFFRMKFLTGLQYRAAAAAGLTTQFFWGSMEILLFKAFYESNPGSMPMDFKALTSYIWLQQAFLSIHNMWIFENDIFQTITDGGAVYELCRPLNLYNMWFSRSMANRLSKAVLRCMPILILAFCLKSPYGMSLPPSPAAAFLFLISFVLAFLNVVALMMLIYISGFYTMQTTGVRILSVSLVDFFSGAMIPLPFFPENIRRIAELLPFASMQNAPFRIYSGDVSGERVLPVLLLQLFWVVVLIFVGRLLTRHALKRIVLQGG